MESMLRNYVLYRSGPESQKRLKPDCFWVSRVLLPDEPFTQYPRSSESDMRPGPNISVFLCPWFISYVYLTAFLTLLFCPKTLFPPLDFYIELEIYIFSGTDFQLRLLPAYYQFEVLSMQGIQSFWRGWLWLFSIQNC